MTPDTPSTGESPDVNLDPLFAEHAARIAARETSDDETVDPRATDGPPATIDYQFTPRPDTWQPRK